MCNYYTFALHLGPILTLFVCRMIVLPRDCCQNDQFFRQKQTIMKQTFFKLSGKKFIAAAFLSTSVLLTSFTANASVNKHEIEILTGENTNVQLTGSTSEALIFKVRVNNAPGDNFTITIKNNNGEVLFSQSFNDVDFQKQFKVLKGEQDSERYFFTISSGNKSIEDTYVISSTVRTVNDIAINKL